MFKKTFWFAVCLCCAAALQAAGPPGVAQQVLDRLYTTNGNYRFKKPKLIISQANDKVAAYNPWKNTITLDQKAYDICRTFGRDSLSALAYILGHELVHAYQSEIKSGRVQTNFLAYHHHYSADVRLEKVADIQGLFNAYLAGYQVLDVMPKVIEKVYRDYDLMGKVLSGYPTLSERKASSQAVLGIAVQLRDVFESSNYLLVIGKYKLATTGYEYILQYYQGAEIYNNLGIACVLSAQEFWNPQTDHFIYPLEADWHTKLSRSISRGQEQLDPTMEPLRAAFLDKAETYFRMAANLNSAYLSAHTNLVCVLNLKGNPVGALKYAELKLLKYVSGRKKRKGQEAEMAEIALGITYALLPGGTRKGEATTIFERLSASKYQASALYAQQNLQFLRGNARSDSQTEIVLPANFRQAIKQMQLGRTAHLERTALGDKTNIRFASQHSGGSSTFVFSSDRGNEVSLLKFQNNNLASASVLAADVDLSAGAYSNIVATKDGFFLRSPADKAVLRVDTRGRVLEMVKYVEH